MIRKNLRWMAALTMAANIAFAPVAVMAAPGDKDGKSTTATPIKHLVIIFQENVSFDHYFGTYPVATNPTDEPKFHAAAGTPTINGYTTALLNNNPNLNPANGTGATKSIPVRSFRGCDPGPESRLPAGTTGL